MEYHATLPVPPSTNNLYVTVVNRTTHKIRRMKSKRYEGWIAEAGYAVSWPRLSEDRSNTIRWRLVLTVAGLSRAADIDNTIKAVSDLIVSMTGLRDNYLEEVTARRAPEGRASGAYVEVHLL